MNIPHHGHHHQSQPPVVGLDLQYMLNPVKGIMKFVYDGLSAAMGNDGRFSTHLPDYVEWLASRYTLGWAGDTGERVYLAPEVTE